MFKARPPSGNSLEAAPTKRTALTAARLLALLAVLAALALAAALSGVLPVQGQTPTVLVSNTGQTATSFNATLNNAEQKRAQGFTTGSEAAGYELSSIGFRFKNVAETAAASKLTATLTEESSGNPGSDLCTLTNPTIAANAVNTFTAPTSCPILAANTTYFFVLERSDASGNSIGVSVTSSGNEDSTPATGWSISNDRHQSTGTAPWNNTAGESYLIEVKGVVRAAAAGTVLVKNTGQTGDGFDYSVDPDYPKSAQLFTTGTSSNYTLSSIGITSSNVITASEAGDDLQVTLNDVGNDNFPDNALCTLTDPASFSSSGVHTFDAPSTDPCPTLTPSTSYFVVIEFVRTNLHTIELTGTTSGSEDAGSLAGWSIGNASIFFDSTDMTWDSTSIAYQIDVRGTALGAGVTISESVLTVTEGGSDNYTVVLDSQPTADVTIDITAGGDVTTNPTSLTFTPSNWSTPKTVTVRANQDDDAVDDSYVITHTVAQGSAAEYHGLSIDDVDVTVVDDDEAGATISKDRLTIDEGGSGTYTIVLDTQPSADVTIIISELVLGVAVNPFHPMFTPSNWNTPQTITVGGIQDDDAVDDSVKITHTVAQGSAAEYLGLSIDDIDVTVVDDDVPLEVTIKKRVASAPTSAPFRVTITFDRAVTGFEEGDVTGWYPGTHFSFDLTDLREETSGLVYSARVDHILDTPDDRLKVIVGSDVAQSVPGDVGNTPGLRSIKVDAPDPGPEPGGTYVWSATMTAGDSAPGSSATGFIGYGRADTVDDLGEIDSPTFTWRGTDYTVLELIHTPAWATVDLLLSEPLPDNGRGMTLHLGGGRWLRFGDYQNVKMTVLDEVDDSRYIWQPVLLGWEQDDSVAVSIRVAGGQAAPQRANTPATGAPTISGAPRVGETLTAGTSGIEDEDGLTGVSFSYQWLVRDGGADTEIEDATASTYTLSDADEGKAFLVRVAFTDDAGNEETLTSHAVAAAATTANTPAEGLPAISGTAQVGETLTADTSGIADADGLDNASFTYQWIADDADIEGATNSTYALAADDEGKTIKVKVTITDDGGNEETLTSAATAAVEPAPNSPATGQPDINGTARVGETLTADVSGIDDADGLDDAVFSYQWTRNDGTEDTYIQDARDSTYVLDADDEGTTIKVRVTFTDDRGHGETLTSAATDAVAGLPPEPLTVSLENEADAHDGETPFTFELRFSEEFHLSYTTLRDHAFTVAGGKVEKAQRLTKGSNIHWRITVQPDSNADVTITLPATGDCDADGAICTADGRKLSNRLELTVSGPDG